MDNSVPDRKGRLWSALMTVRIGSYTALERPGGGHRAAGPTLWRGEDDAGQPVCLLMLPAIDSAEVTHRVAAAQPVTHPHLLPVLDVVRDDERIAVVSAWPRGGRLLELVRRRGTLGPGETLTVLIPLASALAAVHAGGIRHGGVGAGSIFFDNEGRPQLGALAISSIVSDSNDGMPGDYWDVAPEVVRGERLNAAPMTPAADIFSLGSVALYCLTGSSAWPADDPADVLIQSTAGVWPDPADGCAPAELVQVIRQMLLPEPAARPPAVDLVRRLAAVGSPAPIAFGSAPAPAMSSVARWGGRVGESGPARPRARQGPAPAAPSGRVAHHDRLALRHVAPVQPGPPPKVDVDRHALRRSSRRLRPRRPRGGERPTVDGPTALQVLTQRSSAASVSARGSTAVRSPSATPLTRVGIAALAALLAVVVAVQIWVWSSGVEGGGTSRAAGPAASGATEVGNPAGRDPGSGGAAGSAVPENPDWLAVVTALDIARGNALSAADPALLGDVYVPGSAAAAADAATIKSLTDRGWRVAGAVHLIDGVTVLGPRDPPPAGTSAVPPNAQNTAAAPATVSSAASQGQETMVRVAVRARLPSYPMLDLQGRRIGATGALPSRERILTIAATSAGFRISSVTGG